MMSIPRRLRKMAFWTKDELLPKANIERWNIVRGDKVQVVTGDEKGKVGVVKKVVRKKNALIVEGVNVRRRFVRANETRSGFIDKKESLVHYSNVQLVDPVTNQPTRVHRAFLEDGTKVRIANRSGAVVPKPDVLKQFPPKRFNKLTDTEAAEVIAVTYTPPVYPGLIIDPVQRVKIARQLFEKKQAEEGPAVESAMTKMEEEEQARHEREMKVRAVLKEQRFIATDATLRLPEELSRYWKKTAKLRAKKLFEERQTATAAASTAGTQ